MGDRAFAVAGSREWNSLPDAFLSTYLLLLVRAPLTL